MLMLLFKKFATIIIIIAILCVLQSRETENRVKKNEQLPHLSHRLPRTEHKSAQLAHTKQHKQ